jgi:hypothetical protein
LTVFLAGESDETEKKCWNVARTKLTLENIRVRTPAMQTEEAHLGRLVIPTSRAELMTLTKQVQEATLEESSINKKRAQGAYSVQ